MSSDWVMCWHRSRPEPNFAVSICGRLRRSLARVRPRARVCAFYPAGLVAGHHPCSMADCRARREPRRMPLISPMRTRWPATLRGRSLTFWRVYTVEAASA